MAYYAGIEAGGTKFVCCIGDDNGNIIDRFQTPTLSPDETLKEVVNYFKQFPEIISMGIGAFGPVDIDPNSLTYGEIGFTPKLKWRHFNLLKPLKQNFNLPMLIDTDVNCAAFGEYTWGAARNISDFIYITIGTGVGVGGMIHNKLLHGLSHPEAGHIIVSRSPNEKEGFKSVCPYHDSCLEGMAAGPAINKRWGVEHCGKLNEDHPAWELESEYVAQALMDYILILSPKKIILGGGVMHQEQLFPMLRIKVKKLLNGYIQHSIILGDMEDFIIPPQLGDNAGCMGAIALAKQAIIEHNNSQSSMVA